MFHSVRARLTLWYTAIVALVVITFGAMTYVLFSRGIRAATDSSLADTAHDFAAAFKNRPAAVADASMMLDFHYSDRAIMVFGPSKEIVASSRSLIGRDEQQRIIAAVGRGLNGFTTVAGGPEGDGVRVVAVPVDVLQHRYTVVVARDLDEQADRLENIAHALFFGIPLALLLAAAGGYVMARKSLAPVTTMAVKARQIGADTLTERIVVQHERDELGFLANTLNELLERLQRAFESQRRFMADASHELRTPLSIIQGEADVALSRRERSADEYRESLAVIRTAVRKVSRIVESLFLLARSDAGRYPITVSRFYLDELIGDCVRAMRTVAAARDIELACHSPSEMLVVADEALIHRMILNLVDNAIKFTPPGGTVKVEADPAGEDYVIRITDSGIGIADDERDLIFERFYSAARPRSGAGLGLPIARWIAELHQGHLSLERSDSTGSTFVVELPQGDAEMAAVSEAARFSAPMAARTLNDEH